MSDLPTCWYCPECGMVAGHKLWRPHGGDEEHSWADCYGKSVEVPLIPPGTPLTAILDMLGIPYCTGWENRGPGVDPFISFMGQTDKPVLVVDNPATDEVHDG